MAIQTSGEAESAVFALPDDDSEITVLVVDDDPDLLDLTATFLEREQEGFETHTESDPTEAIDTVAEVNCDAIVCDYEMPTLDGLEFLEAVREDYEDIPFILFTGKGSEEIASEAISKGVTDYLEKRTGPEQYSLLANRICNAVEQYRASEALKRSEAKFSKVVKNSTDVLGIVDKNGHFKYISPACESELGYEQEELIGECAFDYMPPEDRQEAMDEFFTAIEYPDKEPTIEFRFEDPEGGWTLVEARGKNLFDDEYINGFVVNARDITEQKEREQELKQQNEQLRNMRQMMSHDLQNPVSVAADSLVLYQDTGNERWLEKVENAVDRIDELLDQVSDHPVGETDITDTETVELRDIVSSAWKTVETPNAELHIESSKEFEADASRLKRVFENLIRNAVEHCDESTVVRVGTTDEGLYFEDTGPGIPEDERDEIFESGYTTDPEKTGFGLNIVREIIIGHGWDITVTESDDGGARFEIAGIVYQPSVYN
ncbi:response regulator [Haloarcula litorea]|uniref:response regulator n=1 Tax=Haloarcula litorea TaxID=3032579 RepID=UPI0023E7FC26|nr:response regulator [Halomicroarcula sp. GDY20]